MLRSHSKWDTPEPVDLNEGEVPRVSNEDLFSEDARPRPPGLGKSKHPGQKTKSDTTTSSGESNSSNPFEEQMSSEFCLKQEAAEKAYESSRERERSYAYVFGGDEISRNAHKGFVGGRHSFLGVRLCLFMTLIKSGCKYKVFNVHI
ncbi:hypothetical protein Tco_1073924 [Tanacetum coccineum]